MCMCFSRNESLMRRHILFHFHQLLLKYNTSGGNFLQIIPKIMSQNSKNNLKRGKVYKIYIKKLKVQEALASLSLLKFSILTPFFSISIPISISKVPKISISISKSIFLKCKFQYQYQNQYFETVVFNIKSNINTSKILTFQNFSKFCPMSAFKYC